MFQAYSSFSAVASTDIRNTDLRLLTKDHMDLAGTWTAIVAVCSFFAGISIVMIYESLKRVRGRSSGMLSLSESLDGRTFFLCGLGNALVTAAFGALCCYVGYYTVSGALDFRALPLGKLILSYAVVNLAIWVIALLWHGRQRKIQKRPHAISTA